MPQEDTTHHYPARLTVRVPAGVPEGVELAARARLQSPAEYLRAIVLQAVRDAGVTIDSTGKVEVRA